MEALGTRGAVLGRAPSKAMALVGSLLAGLLALAASSPVHAAEGGPQRGQEVFREYCAMCHGADASGMMGMHPSLRGAVERLSREGVEVTIRSGRATRPPMPAFEDRLTPSQIADVIAYLGTLPPGPRNFGPAAMPQDRGRAGPGWALAALLGALAAVALLGAGFVGWQAGGRRGSSRPELDRRYAAGELSREEYLRRRRDLEG